ncbi:hypothetical protein [Nitrosomonas sp.]|uniref:hypothetical protein n=1 Tax=Nitrosomonas sp. TaxID=42353 RepID=UPI0025DDB672|nr:hypothetical protein [Nitrosomonas sp.]
MSRRETPMTVWYWEQIGGILIEEFLVIPKRDGQGRRLIDAVIIRGQENARMPVSSRVSLEGKDVVVVQTKNSRLGMYLMGQTLFSAQLVRQHFNPRSVLSVALCSQTDRILQPMLEAYEDCKVVVCPIE